MCWRAHWTEDGRVEGAHAKIYQVLGSRIAATGDGGVGVETTIGDALAPCHDAVVGWLSGSTISSRFVGSREDTTGSHGGSVPSFASADAFVEGTVLAENFDRTSIVGCDDDVAAMMSGFRDVRWTFCGFPER